MNESSPRFRAGQQFAEDLRSIREERGVARKDIMDATRLAEDVIEQFEKTALLDNPVFNRVYLRSLVSAYARQIDIDENVALQALEDTLKGEYEGSLRTIYLSGSPDSGSPDSGSSDSGGFDGAVAADNEPGDPETEPGAADEPRTAAEEAGDDDEGGATGMAVPVAEGARPVAEPEPVEKETAESETTEPAPPEPDADRAASRSKGVGMPPPTGAPAEGRASSDAAAAIHGRTGRRKGLLLPDLRGLMAAVVAAGVLIALVWISVVWFLDTPDEEAPELTVPAVDTTEAVPEPTPEPISLPDTFEVRVIARDEPLDPIRGRVDNDLRRPYWVELGDTLLFRVADTVVLEREVGNALLIIETYLPPVDWLESDGTYTISRSRTQRWLDSLVAAGIFPPVAPDSLDIPGLEELRTGADPQ